MTTTPTEETWSYAGRRVNGSQLVDAWYNNETDRTLLFKIRRGSHYTIGQAYRASVTRDQGSVVVLHGAPLHKTVVGAGLEEAWRAEHAAAAETASETERARKKAARYSRDLGLLTLDDIARAASQMNKRNRAALVAAAIEHIYRSS
jgi:hypothetical protein